MTEFSSSGRARRTMRGVLPSLVLALAGVFNPRILWLMVWPVLLSAAIWGGLLVVFWTETLLALADLLREWIATATFFVQWDPAGVARFAATVLIVIFVIPLIQFTALLIIGFAAMPAAVNHVAERRFPGLHRRRGGSLAGSLWNGFVALAGLIFLFVVTLPLWMFPPLWPAIPIGILAWVNQRVLRYDALAEHASAPEMRQIFAEQRFGLYLLGVLLALASFVPLFGFFAPALFSLAYTHYALAELDALRGAPIDGVVIASDEVAGRIAAEGVRP